MRTYKPATFQPTVRPDWAGALSYIPEKEKSEILVALIKYPSVECNSKFWLETIKPDLDMQFSEFKRICQEKSRGIRERWGKISTTDVKTSITHVIDSERERERKEEYLYLEESNKGGMGGKEKNGCFIPPKDANQVYEYGAANGMVCTMKDAEDFFDYYSGIGWCIGNEHRTPMVAWEPFWKKWLRNPVVRQKPSVRMSLKEAKELAKEQELQKMLNGER